MTCITGAISRGKVALGADSIIIQDDAVDYAADPKVWRSGSAIVGGAGDWLFLDLLHRIDVPTALDENWLRYGFTAAYRKLTSDLGVEPDGEALVGALGSLWFLSGNSLIKIGTSYAAIGIGQSVATGALSVLSASVPARKRCERALESAEKHCSGVRGPFTILEL